jgi:hypothetical protein
VEIIILELLTLLEIKDMEQMLIFNRLSPLTKIYLFWANVSMLLEMAIGCPTGSVSFH